MKVWMKNWNVWSKEIFITEFFCHLKCAYLVPESHMHYTTDINAVYILAYIWTYSTY